MHQAVLVNADVHESPESGHIGDYSREFLAGLQVPYLLGFAENEGLELLARVAAGLGQLGDDVLQGGLAHFFGDIL